MEIDKEGIVQRLTQVILDLGDTKVLQQRVGKSDAELIADAVVDALAQLPTSAAKTHQLSKADNRSSHGIAYATDLLTEDGARQLLRQQMLAAGGLIKWANAKEIPISRVSEFNTGRRPASAAILVGLGLTRTIVPLHVVFPPKV